MTNDRKSRLTMLVDGLVFTLDELKKRDLGLKRSVSAMVAAALVVACWIDEGAAFDAVQSTPPPTPTYWDSEVLKPYINSIQINLDVARSMPLTDVTEAKIKVLENVLQMLKDEKP